MAMCCVPAGCSSPLDEPQPHTVFQDRQGKRTIDVYWLSDDGGHYGIDNTIHYYRGVDVDLFGFFWAGDGMLDNDEHRRVNALCYCVRACMIMFLLFVHVYVIMAGFPRYVKKLLTLRAS